MTRWRKVGLLRRQGEQAGHADRFCRWESGGTAQAGAGERAACTRADAGSRLAVAPATSDVAPPRRTQEWELHKPARRERSARESVTRPRRTARLVAEPAPPRSLPVRCGSHAV